MSRFRKTGPREVPALNTASLPDLIFTLLFFFLLVANMRSVPTLTKFEMPNAVELQKLKEKSLLIFIIVGQQDPQEKEKLPEIQLNYNFTTLEKMPEDLRKIKSEIKAEDHDKMTVVLRIDKNTPMGLVNDIRKTLREANLLTVFYAAEKGKP
ncbi:biopolymer transporter ExbD [Bacteroidia bacterium]|nr:biopolymer transporter ExbD [Bacteroidia bacterium]GHV70880.1 biopolymer transporter ExbD [Bacteroidia bacterium]